MLRCRIFSRILVQQLSLNKIDYARPCSAIGNNLNIRKQCTVTIKESYIKKFMKAVGWMDQDRTRLKLTGYFLYESVPEKVSYNEWFQKLELPDTFASWFIITELHVWILLVRYMAVDITTVDVEKKKYVKGDGHFVRNCIIEAQWADVANRIKLLEGANPSIARKQVTELSEQFQAALVGYDEGLNDDRVLAAAIWRRFYSLSDDAKAENVEKILHFVRHQVVLDGFCSDNKPVNGGVIDDLSEWDKPNLVQLSELDKIPSESLRWKPQIKWLSILDH